MDGMSLGCLVAGGVALVGSIAAFIALPDRVADEAPHPGEWADAEA